MLKDDWLMNLIRQSVKAMHHILGFIETDQLDEAEDAIDEAAQQLVGFTWTQIDNMSSNEMTNFLGVNEQAGIGQMILLADLLFAAGKIADLDDDEERSYRHMLRALEIRLELAIGHDLSNAHLDHTVDELVVELEDFVLPTPTTQQLMVYYEKTTQYDKAENYLWELIDDHITDDDMVAEGLSFYERLLLKTDTELSAGAVTREEMEEGFNELWQKKKS